MNRRTLLRGLVAGLAAVVLRPVASLPALAPIGRAAGGPIFPGRLYRCDGGEIWIPDEPGWVVPLRELDRQIAKQLADDIYDPIIARVERETDA